MSDREVDPMTLKIMRNQSESVAEEMGRVFITSSCSPSTEGRHGYSTALFDANGRLVTQTERIPVHLGAVPEAVGTVLDYGPGPGDVFALSDLFKGGTHLPDVTMVSLFSVDGEVFGYAVLRVHHADASGMAPDNIPAGAREVYREKLKPPPVGLVIGGETDDDVLSLLLANVHSPGKRCAGVHAQSTANECAGERLADPVEEHGRSCVPAALDAVMDYSRDHVIAELRDLPDGEYRAHDVFEGDGIADDSISVKVTVTVSSDTVTFDFDGTTDQVAGNVNAPFAVAKSVVYFIIHCAADPEIPPNQGRYDPIPAEVPDGSFPNPDAPAAVVGGNVETNQRVIDVVFAVLIDAAPKRVPVQGQGTMNNLIIGNCVGGSDGFIYYETIGGGFDSRAGGDGMGGV